MLSNFLSARAGRVLTLVLSLSAIGACTTVVPLVVDIKATAPVLDGFGDSKFASGSSNEAARQLFAQGVDQAFAFNEGEAVRSFKAALAQDPSCAMCAWGVAWQLGPNINRPERGDLKSAISYVDYAVKHSESSSPRDKALIQSLALRYGHQAARSIAPLPADMCIGPAGKSVPVNPLDGAYADMLRSMVKQYPADSDVLALYAEAEMLVTRGAYWDRETGKPNGRIGALSSQLEEGLKRTPEHVGLNHYLIHATDSFVAASRAEGAADRLAKLAPKSPHLLHMPSHTYTQVGRFADATRVNQLAVAADAAQEETLKKQGFSNTKDWRFHNLHVQWYAALMEGRGDLALETARTQAARSANGAHVMDQYMRSLPLLTMLQLQRWEAILAEPLPKADKGLDKAFSDMVRGIALLQQGKLDEARANLERIKAIEKAMAEDKGLTGMFGQIARVQVHTIKDELSAEILFKEGKVDDAVKAMVHTVEVAAFVELREPPFFASIPRLRLGEMQLLAKRPADAEKTFRKDLADRPKNGWALSGLQRALSAQGRSEDAAAVQRQLALSWVAADKSLAKTGP